MRFDLAVVAVSAFTTAVASVIEGQQRNVVRFEAESRSDEHDLYKRRGGGGGGGRGGGGGGGSGGSSGGGRSGGSGGSSGGGSGGSGGSRSSNSGGRSGSGSGPPPAYGGGRYYGGGAVAPYRSGGRSASGILPFALVGGALLFWPGVWLYGAYMYPYHNHYRYHNDTSEEDESRPVICGCAQYAVCGCDEANDTSYLDELIGNGSYAALNKTVVNVADVNGTTTILINGTLPNGTTAAEESTSSGDSNSDPDEESAAGASMRAMAEALGFWPACAAVLATVFLV